MIIEIGSGSFATVHKAYCKPLNKLVAIKIIQLEQVNRDEFDNLQREVIIMANLKHTNLTSLVTSFCTGTELWIVMTFAGRSCADVLKCNGNANGIKDERLLASIIKYVLLGLQYMHNNNYIHRDVKPPNIMISDTGIVALADFGVSNSLCHHGVRLKQRQTFTGTPVYMAPEFFCNDNHGHNQLVDCWSLGITLLELAYGRHPYGDFSGLKVLITLITADIPSPCGDDYKDLSYRFSKQFHSFVRKCLRKDPARRYTLKQLLGHSFLKTALDASYITKQLF
jgi:serine/threonine-protein kinase OSR1/STK39